MPSGIPCRPGHHAVWDAMPSGTPCRLGYHAVWDTMPSGMPCRLGCHAVWDTMPSGIPCRLGYHAVWDAHRSERFESVADGIAAGWHTLCWRPAASSAFCSSALVCRGFVARAQRGTRASRCIRRRTSPPGTATLCTGTAASVPGFCCAGTTGIGFIGSSQCLGLSIATPVRKRLSHGAHEPALGGTPC